MKILNDVAAENGILAGLIRYGNDAYADVGGIISEDSFVHGHNSTIYKCIKKLLEEDSSIGVDIPSIYSAAKGLGLEFVFKKKDQIDHLNSLLSLPVNRSNLEKFAKKLRKFEVARLQIEQLKEAQDKLLTLTGDETISQILSIPEDAIFNFQALLNQDTSGPTLLLKDMAGYVDEKAENPKEQMGISSGLKYWDAAIGGGLRGSTVNMIAARPKQGKSILAARIGTYIAKDLNLPALYLDTEMQDYDQKDRILSMTSGVDLHDIETGKYAKNSFKYNKVREIAQNICKAPFYYKSIAGVGTEDIIATIRRWLIKEVGLNQDGTAKQCVIIYDYLKIMDMADIRGDIKEHQLIGYMLMSLHNLTRKYDVPAVVFSQLNRDGIDKEDTSGAAMSDRITWFCSNFSILKRKTDEEFAEDGPLLGNKKLIPVICRHGGEMNYGEYICLNFEGSKMRFTELGLNTTLRKQNNQTKSEDVNENGEF